MNIAHTRKTEFCFNVYVNVMLRVAQREYLLFSHLSWCKEHKLCYCHLLSGLCLFVTHTNKL